MFPKKYHRISFNYLLLGLCLYVKEDTFEWRDYVRVSYFSRFLKFILICFGAKDRGLFVLSYKHIFEMIS